MNSTAQSPLSFVEMFELPTVVDVRTAARALGVCPATVYRMLQRQVFPCPVLRVGGRYRIPTIELMRALGVDEHPVYSMELHRPTEFVQEAFAF
ncbi:helix-turn-helix domain-containing protein [Kitasatospora sp. YST-16]|uniref:helix-turn-helix domain-containing protein n=1 Tax=Kitasatospora sp. YST-16 TaxID=2998080 RepID=UPI002284938D|nr:helix-turn-helix domain-containing protein [Kitasatospora sp. YST-16]WAL75567.1 helix-turn-helix domain-containing protein [Kitasatospora sp. YST-16]WNW41633.1 helix-turn-helix domain-containing protein [Streptomyces sp. Li-HN-5-13]